VSTNHGSGPRVRSVTTRQKPSGVCPGVCSTVTRTLPSLVLLAVLQTHVREFDGRRGVDEHRRTGNDREPPSARHVVRLHVRLEDVGDAHVLLSGRLDVGLDLVLWIHHSAAGCAPSAEEVAGAAGLGREKLSEDHEMGLLPPIHGTARLVHSYSVELIIANTVFLMDR
jgi:hypothetical protein